MINEYIRYTIPAERADAFLDAYRDAQQHLRGSPHCLGYDLARCAEDPTRFILRIEWDSPDGHLRGFRGSPAFQPFVRAVRPFIEAIEEMRHYELTDVRWSRPA